MDEQKLPLCIKLDKGTRDAFKAITHKKNITMQKLTKAFIEYYVLNPDVFIIQNNLVFKINENEVSI